MVVLTPIERETLQVSFYVFHGCSMCPPLLIRQTSMRKSTWFHTRVSISRSTRATSAVIRLRRSRRLAGSGGTKTVSFTNPHKKKSHGVKSGDRGGHRINASSSCPVRIPKHKMTAHVFGTPYLLLLSPSGKSRQQCARAFH